MADGKKERNILPYNNYRSGLRAGRSIEREHALKAFSKVLNNEGIASGERADQLRQAFADTLRAEEDSQPLP